MFVTEGKKYASNYYPPTFRAPRGERRRPVPGGRWLVRKVWKFGFGGPQAWRAWTKGTAPKPRSKTFNTFDEAIRYAQGRARGVEHFRLLSELARGEACAD